MKKMSSKVEENSINDKEYKFKLKKHNKHK
jgi:hypothetical protein